MKQTYISSGMFTNNFTALFYTPELKKFYTVTQYVMYMKAITVDELDISREILEERNPRRCVLTMDSTDVCNNKLIRWIEFEPNVMLDGMRMKFQQNDHITRTLLDIGLTEYIYLNDNSIYGTGLHDRSLAANKENWVGKNVFGELLTKIFNEIIYNEISDKV